MSELNLESFLGSYSGQNVDFFRFPGNYGDSLIWHGTKNLLSRLNITELYVDISSKKHNDILLIDGGGNLVDYYSDILNFLVEKSSVYEEIIILPHTIFGTRQINALNNLRSKLTVFCREKVTYESLKHELKKADVFLWHDCAFYNIFPITPHGKGILNAFRTDKESVQTNISVLNNDLSYNGYATKPLDEMIDTLQKYEQINTDRLHIAISATLLGKKVQLFPNSYYKNKAVFDYSLKKFPNIVFVEQ